MFKSKDQTVLASSLKYNFFFFLRKKDQNLHALGKQMKAPQKTIFQRTLTQQLQLTCSKNSSYDGLLSSQREFTELAKILNKYLYFFFFLGLQMQ